MAISIGYDNQAGAGNFSMATTLVSGEGPANADGSLDTVKLRVSGTVYGKTSVCYIGTFSGTPPAFTSRDYVDLGALTTGNHTIIGLSIDAITGDYIGCIADAINTGVLGGKTFYSSPKFSVWFDGVEHTYGTNSNKYLAVYATGTETPPPVTSPSAGAKKAAMIFQRGL